MALAEIRDARAYQLPEAYQPEPSSLRPYAEAFGAGVIDPAGLPSSLLNAILSRPETDWFKRWAQEKRDQSPPAAGAGSMVLPMAGLIGRFGGFAQPAREIAEVMGYGAGTGAALGNIRDVLAPPRMRTRPQAAYPGGGF